jgi:hypothetical protein
VDINKKERRMIRKTLKGAALVTACLLASPALGVPLPPGGSSWKTHPTVPEVPKYTIGLPAYLVPGNIVGTLTSAITSAGSSVISGFVTTTVYVNPATGFLTFQYQISTTADTTAPVVRSTIAGDWHMTTITDAGSDASGLSGALDPAPEWSDGDPMFLYTDMNAGEGFADPSMQFRETGRGTVLGPGDMSARVWFETTATEFTTDVMGLIDSGTVGTAPILTVIPAPAAAVLGLMGFGMLRWAARRFA